MRREMQARQGGALAAGRCGHGREVQIDAAKSRQMQYIASF